ncbi:MAG TPA: transglycosylase SLT domain-containing protein [Candidatus Rifleibacterium sp.]|nr:transglycosylase SLT domain-containing protein [Candidatus Rifleibacterium sp.]HPT44706.1 transglycosylase SLT domain-containing protein [Candidatus Rifleibacterium sp.]
MKRALWFTGIMTLGLAVQAGAAIYSYRDEHGRLFLTDSPPNRNYKIVVTSKKEREGPDSPGATSFAVSSSAPAQKFLLPNDDSFSKYINEAAEVCGVDPYLIKSVIKVESDFDPQAMSSKGAQGLMQLIPSTARLVGCNDSFNPRQNILGGANYLKMMLKRFEGRIDYALAAYNAGPGNVEKHGGIPPFRETQNYVRKVRHYYKQYAANLPVAEKATSSKAKKARVMPLLHSDLSRRLTDAYEKFRDSNVSGAMDSYRDILNIYPRNTQALYNLACLLDMERCYEEAIDVYLAALKQDPFLDKALYNLAVIYERLGMHAEAIDTWKNYVQVAKDEEKIVMAEKFMKELREYAALN